MSSAAEYASLVAVLRHNGKKAWLESEMLRGQLLAERASRARLVRWFAAQTVLAVIGWLAYLAKAI